MMVVNTIELDGYDLDVFARILRTEPNLQAHRDRLGRLLPHPEPLLQDLFGVLFKLNVLIEPPPNVAPSALVNRRLVESVLGHPGVKALRARTQLDEAESRDALVLLADRVLKALTRRGRASPEGLSEGMEAAEHEAALAEKEDLLEKLEEMEGLDENTAAEVKKDLKRERQALKEKLDKSRRQQSRHADALPIDMDNEIGASVEQMTSDLSELDGNIRGLGLGAGATGKQDARRRLELGDRLARSKKLRLLARLAGAFKEFAFEARRKTIPRAPQTVHAVGKGSDLGHLLPSELPGLDKRRRGVHLDFLRRFVEGELMQYELRAPASRGPMVVCVDGSGSMTGSKELWAKAVALTLMEIARREKRRCLALVFSNGPDLFEVELLDRGRGSGSRLAVRDAAVLAFAEHFPGGGTSFEPPLRRATEAVSEGRYRGGDIIFITDGEAQVSEALVEEVRRAKKQHRFKVRGLVVDLDHHRTEELAKVADEIRSVSDLTGDALGDLFSAV